MRLFIFLALGFVAGCRSPGPSRAPRENRAVAPGQEPLETETLDDEEVVPLKPPPRSKTPPPGRPCAWAAVWNDPKAAHPLFAGVGGVPMPEKTQDARIAIRASEGTATGEIVVEIVIDPEGRVTEAAVVQADEPRRPQVESAILKAVRKWRYEKPTFDGTPVAICSTLVLGLGSGS